MAFGTPRTGSPLTATSTASNTSLTASGSISVQSGDLIIAHLICDRPLSSFTWTDSNSNSYTAITNIGSNAKAAYFLATGSFTLTSVTGNFASTPGSKTLVVTVYEGAFASVPLDKNPASAADAASPFDCPASGTLSQADELVVGHSGYVTNNVSIISSWAATSPATMSGTAEAVGALASSGIAQSYKVVSATTSTSNSFTGTNPTSGNNVATTTWKKAAGAAALIVKPRLNTLLRM